MQSFEVSAPNPHIQQAQKGYPMYNEGISDAKGVAQRNMIAMQLRNNMTAPGKGLVIIFGLIVIFASIAASYKVEKSNYYKVLIRYYETYNGSYFSSREIFDLSGYPCRIYLIAFLGLPFTLLYFAAFNLLATCFACCGTSCCMFFQALMALVCGGFATYLSQQSCSGMIAFTALFGSGNTPQGAWPYYAGMAGASLLSCLINYFWSWSRDKAERDQRNLSLMLAAS